MPKDDMVRLRHMLDAAKEAVSFVEGKKRKDLDTDRYLVLSIWKLVEIVGEAANQVTKERQEKLRGIPWARVIGMRNRLTHAYMDVDLDILWSTVANDLPPLIEALQKVIPR
jgi:uncharacterized protein with HEPN domain